MKTKFTYRQTLRVSILFTAGILLAYSSNAQTKHFVEVTNNVFTPKEIKINPGDTVEWKNSQGFHNVNGSKNTYPDNPESFGNSTGVGWTYSYVFTVPGKYDYQCDPHIGYGMVGKVEVEGNDDNKKILTVNFSGMNPHVGQTLWLAVKEKDSGKEIERKSEIVSTEFSLQISGLEIDHSYHIDFFTDHNKNGTYDAPPVDHAWRLILNNVQGDTTLNFTHNINFTDINLTTGIGEKSNFSDEISVYPNPADKKININLSGMDHDFIYKIYNSSGVLLKQGNEYGSGLPVEVDVSQFVSGLYFLSVETTVKSGVMKFIKQ